MSLQKLSAPEILTKYLTWDEVGVSPNTVKILKAMEEYASQSESELIRLKEDNERLKEENLSLLKDYNFYLNKSEKLEQQLEQSNVPRWVKAGIGNTEGRSEELKELYRKWCKETKRGGGVLIGKSIGEFFEWLEELPDKRQSPDK